MDKLYKWYIIHTVSGSEKKIRQLILDSAAKKNMSEYFEDIVVPVIEVPEIKKGKSVKTEKKFMPGYVFVKMHMTDDSWHLVKSVPKITGFLGSKSQPKPLSDSEIESVFKNIETENKGATFAKLYDVGEQVIVIDGPFDSFTGLIEEVDHEKKKLKISISIFGKATPIELSFSQVKKN